MRSMLAAVAVSVDEDIARARHRARLAAEFLGFDVSDQTRVATAVSEIARDAHRRGRGVRVQLSFEDEAPPASLLATITDEGPREGVAIEPAITARTAGRLVDEMRIERDGQGTRITVAKRLPLEVKHPTVEALNTFVSSLGRHPGGDVNSELREQNEQLVAALDALRAQQNDLARLNLELAETNRGVLALYAELEEKAERLRRESEVKTRFFSEMNHEVRTPVNAILSLSRILLNGTVSPVLADQQKPLELIQQSAEHLSDLVDDLLDLARVEAGRMPMRFATVSLAEVFGALRGVFRPLHAREAVALLFDDVEQIPRFITDEGKLQQILRNLISNALKFTERGSVRVTAQRSGDGDLVLSVVDTGLGIAAEDLDKLFVSFSQIDNRLQRSSKGSGIGLSLSRHLAELLGGTLSVTSTLGQGSTFTLVLPPLASAPAHDDVAGNPPRLLVIDNDAAARFLVNEAARGLFEVTEASSGAEGLRAARAHPPSVIVLDLRMPEVDGYEVLDALKASSETRDIPVVIHSSARLTAAETGRLAQAAEIVSKERVAREGVEPLRDALNRLAACGPSTAGLR